MELIKSNKGALKLLHKGYAYTKKTTNKSSIRWECSQRVCFSCKGALTTDLLVIVAAGSIANLKQTVRRAKKGGGPKNLSTMRELPVPIVEGYAENITHDNESDYLQRAQTISSLEEFMNTLGKIISIK